MSYPVWPSTLPAPDDGSEGRNYRPAVKTDFDSNYTQTRPKVSRTREKWSLKWAKMEESDYQTLKTFFDTYQGCLFTWTNPRTGLSHTCVFSGDELGYKYIEPSYRDVTCEIEEV